MNIERPEIITVIRRGPSKVLRVNVAGEIDDSSAPVLREALARAIAEDGRRIEVDLTGVTFFACAGVTVLFGTQQAAAGRLGLIAAGPSVRRVLHLLDPESAFGGTPCESPASVEGS